MIGCQTERGDRPGELVLRRPAGVAGRVKLVQYCTVFYHTVEYVLYSKYSYFVQSCPEIILSQHTFPTYFPNFSCLPRKKTATRPQLAGGAQEALHPPRTVVNVPCRDRHPVRVRKSIQVRLHCALLSAFSHAAHHSLRFLSRQSDGEASAGAACARFEVRRL